MYHFSEQHPSLRFSSLTSAINPIGEGMCKRIPEYPDYGDGVKADEPFCYVHQPSSCPDLKRSEVYDMEGERYSSFACKQKQGNMN